MWLLCCSILPAAVAFGNTYQLAPRASAGSGQRVQMLVEVRGALKVPGKDGEVASVPLEVDAKLLYWERLVENSPEPWTRRSMRMYEEAVANIRAGKGLVNHSLPPEHRLIAAYAQRGETSLYCPLEPLGREELDLIDVQGNSLLLDELLPSRAVAVGDTWEPPAAFLAPLLGLEAATQSTVSGRLAGIEDNLAVIELAGRVDGAVGGVASEIELKAKCNFDLEQKHVTWFAVSLREKRAIGHAAPGLEVTARLRMVLQPGNPPEELSDGRLVRLLGGASGDEELPESGPGPLAQLLERQAAAASLLSYQPEHADYRLIHDRRWRATAERPGLTILRMVDRGDLVAQCNISEMTDAEPGQHLTLETFQADIRRSLGDLFGQVVEATQSSGEDGLRVLRVTVVGMASEISVQWIYYHFSDGSGRRAAMAFTLESKLLEQFAEADRMLAESFQFTPRQQPQEARRESEPRRS